MDNRPPLTRAVDSDAHITPAMEDYLKAIHRLGEAGGEVTNQRLTEELRISGASVSNMLKKLDDLKLIVHERYKGVMLTETGTAVALEVIRHHRLLELFLSQSLGMDLALVHSEADRLEHHVSEELEDRIEAALGNPQFDPHGHPIPARDGTLPSPDDLALSDVEADFSGVISRIDDRDPDLLRVLLRHGLLPGTPISVDHPMGDSETTFETGDGIRVTLTADRAAAVFVRADAISRSTR